MGKRWIRKKILMSEYSCLHYLILSNIFCRQNWDESYENWKEKYMKERLEKTEKKFKRKEKKNKKNTKCRRTSHGSEKVLVEDGSKEGSLSSYIDSASSDEDFVAKFN